MDTPTTPRKRTLSEIQADLTELSRQGVRANHYYDTAPDGSEQKREAIGWIDRLAKKRATLEAESEEAYLEMELD